MAGPDFWHHHGGISVPDLDTAIAWWEKSLDFTLEHKREIPTVPCEMAMMKNGGLRIELFCVPDAKAPVEARDIPDEDLKVWGNKHVSFAVEDVVALSETLRARGVDIVWVKTFDWGGANMFVRDNCGNLVEFVKAVRPEEYGGHIKEETAA